MWDDDMINKPCAQLRLFGFCLHGIGGVIGERWRERVTVCLFACVCSFMWEPHGRVNVRFWS